MLIIYCQGLIDSIRRRGYVTPVNYKIQTSSRTVLFLVTLATLVL